MIGQEGHVSSQAIDPTVGLIVWNTAKKKFDLMAGEEILVSSKDKGYLNYLVVKQKHSAILGAGIKTTKLVADETSFGISQDLLDGISAEMQPYVDAGIKPEFSRPRGRPRKYIPNVDNCRRHTMEDNEDKVMDIRYLLPITKHKIILDFKEYLEENWVPKKALEKICELYKITYFQAYNICASYI
jgi:hypothetical protein